jgi:outer membrane receptor protein involved in Fe transport
VTTRRFLIARWIFLALAFVTSAPAAAQSDEETAEDEPEYEATAEVEAPSTSVTRHSFEAEELASVPGARGDAIRAVDILPGTGRGSGFPGGIPVIRGAQQLESQVLLDGTPVPLLFHFGDITSFFQSRLLDRVDFYPGNFSARYGRVVGGIIEARVRDPRADGLHGILDLSVLDSSVLVEGPLGKHAGVALAARRSNIDFFFSQFVPEDAYSVVAAPVYYDYQALGTYRFGQHRLRLLGYGSRDSFELILSKPDAADPTLRGAVGGSVEFHHLNFRLDSKLSEEVRHTASLTLGRQDIAVHLGPDLREQRDYQLFGRSELEMRVSREVQVAFGVDVVGAVIDGAYSGQRPFGFEGSENAFESSLLAQTIQVELEPQWVVSPAFWAEVSLRPIEHVLVVPGVRADYYNNLRAWTLDPRLAVRHELTDFTTFKAGVGLFSQAPQWYEALEGVSNPELDPYHALHWSAGVEQKLGDAVELDVEGFYKRLFERVVPTEGGRAPHLVNDGRGRIYGAEIGASLRPSPRTFAYLAYTLSRSERQDRNAAWRLFDDDQTHVLSAVFSQRFGAGWQAGARFRLISGRPFTPVLSAVYDARVDLYRPVYAPINSEREATFHQLDVRVEKQWRITSDFKLAAYLEVLNAYNASNPEGVRYSYDYSKRETVSGLPILPNLGVRGEL